jgi:hypothetical protein
MVNGRPSASFSCAMRYRPGQGSAWLERKALVSHAVDAMDAAPFATWNAALSNHLLDPPVLFSVAGLRAPFKKTPLSDRNIAKP